ncbi:hypothetical protein ACFP81_05210 [Deinococcus lacus]|uniref:Uncharacterized protein n=1 Tax=Deinococcus lacus TaxID=392561 RepID=A0ABW1YDG8_9DEIO
MTTKIYAVTGSASGIGAATRTLLEGQGHRVTGRRTIAARRRGGGRGELAQACYGQH